MTLITRAARNTALSRRRELARSIRELVREAERGGATSRLRVRPPWERVVAARGELIELADVLTRPAPVPVRGVAQVLALLTDGTGPLYDPHSRENLRARAALALDSLRA